MCSCFHLSVLGLFLECYSIVFLENTPFYQAQKISTEQKTKKNRMEAIIALKSERRVEQSELLLQYPIMLTT